MATEQKCADALDRLAARIDPDAAPSDFDRTLTCTLRDLDVVFGGRVQGGRLTDIHRTTSSDAQIRITMASDDLVALVDGTLRLAPAWATGRVTVRAGVRDLLRLKSMF